MTNDSSIHQALFIIIERSTIVKDEFINTDEIIASHLANLNTNSKNINFDSRSHPVQQMRKLSDPKNVSNEDKKKSNENLIKSSIKTKLKNQNKSKTASDSKPVTDDEITIKKRQKNNKLSKTTNMKEKFKRKYKISNKKIEG